jgi:hypothetical protein
VSSTEQKLDNRGMGPPLNMQGHSRNKRPMGTKGEQKERSHNNGMLSSIREILRQGIATDQLLQNILTCILYVRHSKRKRNGSRRMGKKGKNAIGKEIRLGMAGTAETCVMEIMERCDRVSGPGQSNIAHPWRVE